MTSTSKAPKRTILLAPEFSYLSEFIEQLPDHFETIGKTIYHKRNLIKVITPPCGPLLNVKRYCKPNWFNLPVYSLGVRVPKGLRAFTYPHRLKAAGINTPDPVAYIEERCHGLLGYSYFVSLQLDYGHTLYEMDQASPESYTPIASALAHFAANMHKANILHKDFTPGNILWKTNGNSVSFALVDINRMYFGPVSSQQGLKNLTRLWGPKDFFIKLIGQYAEERRIDRQEAIDFALKVRCKFWQRYEARHGLPCNIEF